MLSLLALVVNNVEVRMVTAAFMQNNTWIIWAVATSATMHDAYGASEYTNLLADFAEWRRDRESEEQAVLGNSTENHLFCEFDSRSEHTDM